MAITINVNLDEILKALKDDLSFAGNADKYIKVNATEDGFELATVSSGNWAPLNDPTFTTKITTPIVRASGSGGLIFESNNGTQVADFGAGGGSNASFYGGVTIAGQLAVDTNTLFVDAVNNRVGIRTSTPQNMLDVDAGIITGNQNVLMDVSMNHTSYGDLSVQLLQNLSRVGFYLKSPLGIMAVMQKSITSEIICNADGYINITSGLGTSIQSQSSPTFHGAVLKVKSISTDGVGQIIEAAAGQTANLLEIRNSSASILTHFTNNGAFSPASMSDTSAANNTIYYSTDAGKLVYKDALGVVNNLY